MENDQLSDQSFQMPVTVDKNADQCIKETLPSFRFTSMQQSYTEDVHTEANSTADVDIARSVQLLLTEMQSLKEDFDTKVKYDESKERLIDSLHQELQAYREGLHFKILRPIFIDLIAMHDDLGKLIQNATTEEPDLISNRTAKNLESFQDTIEEILRRNGVETFSLNGDAFLPNKQRAIQAIDTIDPALDKQVARKVRKGFEYDGRVLRPELVVTYRTISGK